MRQHYPNFFLIGVFANFDVRSKRALKKHGDDYYGDFKKDDERDSGKNQEEYGQRVTDTFRQSDVVLINNQDFYKDLGKIDIETTIREDVFSTFKTRFKILDYCRALHAEENAILNVARIGASSALAGATLYTSTYPCNLCANKIAQVGIMRVVYFEPYPMEEAKQILERENVEQIPFQGVTYQGYFRLMEVVY